MKKVFFKIIVFILLILSVWGIYKVIKLPPGMSYHSWGTYEVDLPEGTRSFTYLSIDNADFHVFNETTGLFLYGTYEELEDGSYRLSGKHINEQIISLSRDYKIEITLNNETIMFKKRTDTPMEVSSSVDKAKDNDRKTQAQMQFGSDENVNVSLFEGTFACVDPDGKLSEAVPYRFVPFTKSFYLYNEQNEFYEKGALEEIYPHSKYILSGERIQKQTIYPQKNGFVITIDDREYVFVKINDDALISEEGVLIE